MWRIRQQNHITFSYLFWLVKSSAIIQKMRRLHAFQVKHSCHTLVDTSLAPTSVQKNQQIRCSDISKFCIHGHQVHGATFVIWSKTDV